MHYEKKEFLNNCNKSYRHRNEANTVDLFTSDLLKGGPANATRRA
jgi:hypothetical protein